MYGGYGYGGFGQRGYGVDVNHDGISDYNVRPGVGVDINGDGFSDYRTGPTITPGLGAYGGYGNAYGY